MARILAVDDDLDILTIVEGALEAEGHELLAISDPHEVATQAEKFKPDAVILDVCMPHLSGFDVLQELRTSAETLGVPVLFLSALGESQDRIDGLRKGADDYLAKPFAPEELVLRVDRLCAQRYRQGSDGAGAVELLERALETGEFERYPVYFGRYRATGELGRGGMGLVLKGYDYRLRRQVALKTLRLAEGVSAETFQERFAALLEEAAMLARFSHPSIVAVYDAGTVSADTGFIVLEWVDGRSLGDWLVAGEALTLARILEIGEAVAAGLAVARKAGVVHQDLKPGNVLISVDGRIKITDFGVARLAGAVHRRSDQVYGTPGYLAPEAFCLEPQTHASDIYSLGAILYRSLSGVGASGGGAIRDVVARTLGRMPPPLPSSVPAPLCELVFRMLSKEPEQRPTARQTLESLGYIRSGLTPELSESVPARSRRGG